MTQGAWSWQSIAPDVAHIKRTGSFSEVGGNAPDKVLRSDQPQPKAAEGKDGTFTEDRFHSGSGPGTDHVCPLYPWLRVHLCADNANKALPCPGVCLQS